VGNELGELSTFFGFPPEIRPMIYTNNAIEGYNRQLRKVTKNKTGFPTEESIRNWSKILNQLVIYFEGGITVGIPDLHNTINSLACGIINDFHLVRPDCHL
jgi:hypothetical protein